MACVASCCFVYTLKIVNWQLFGHCVNIWSGSIHDQNILSSPHSPHTNYIRHHFYFNSSLLKYSFSWKSVPLSSVNNNIIVVCVYFCSCGQLCVFVWEYVVVCMWLKLFMYICMYISVWAMTRRTCVFSHKLKVINRNTITKFKAQLILTLLLSLIIYRREFIFSSLRSD